MEVVAFQQYRILPAPKQPEIILDPDLRPEFRPRITWRRSASVGVWAEFDGIIEEVIIGNFGEILQSAFSDPHETIQHWTIKQSDLPREEPYKLAASISVLMTQDSETEFTAEIKAANLAATGFTRNEAFNYLICELLDAFDYLSAHESELGLGPAAQFAFLRAYLGKTDNGSR